MVVNHHSPPSLSLLLPLDLLLLAREAVVHVDVVEEERLRLVGVDLLDLQRRTERDNPVSAGRCNTRTGRLGVGNSFVVVKKEQHSSILKHMYFSCTVLMYTYTNATRTKTPMRTPSFTIAVPRTALIAGLGLS